MSGESRIEAFLEQLTAAEDYQGQIEHLSDPGTGPEEQTQKQQDLDTLQIAMAHLPARQRLLLRLRFQEGLSLKKIAELTQLGDTNRVWRHVQAALKALFQLIHEKNSAKSRKN